MEPTVLRQILHFLFTVACARGLASCVPVEHRTVNTFDILQTALVPPPSPMGADAPLTPTRGFSVEGGATVSQADETRDTRRAGASGHATPVVTVRGRFTWRPHRRVEFGLSGEGAPSAWGVATARDVDPSRIGNSFFRLGPHVRVVFNPDSVARLGVSSSLLAGVVPWVRDVSVMTEDITFDPNTGQVIRRSTGTTSASVNGQSSYVWVNLAFFLTGDLGRHGSVLGGVSVQNQPVAFGQRTVMHACDDPTNLFLPRCAGTTVDTTPVLASTFASTIFASGELRLGASLSLVARAHIVLAGDRAVVTAGRFGGGIDLRGTFGP